MNIAMWTAISKNAQKYNKSLLATPYYVAEKQQNIHSKISVVLPYNMWKTIDNLQEQGIQVKNTSMVWSTAELELELQYIGPGHFG